MLLVINTADFRQRGAGSVSSASFSICSLKQRTTFLLIFQLLTSDLEVVRGALAYSSGGGGVRHSHGELVKVQPGIAADYQAT